MVTIKFLLIVFLAQEWKKKPQLFPLHDFWDIDDDDDDDFYLS